MAEIVEQYGSNHRQTCVKFGGNIPVQIVGFVGTYPIDTDCIQNPCIQIPAFDGDFNSFLYEFPSPTDTADYRLEKLVNGAYVEQTTLNDNTYGTYTGVGDIAEYPTYSGFKLSWTLVFAAFGYGVYRFVVNDSVTPSNNLYSCCFYLQNDLCDDINGTFRLSITNVGKYGNRYYTKTNRTLKNFDLINLEWQDQCRYYGRILQTDIEKEQEFVQGNNLEYNLAYERESVRFESFNFRITQDLFNRVVFYGKGKDLIIDDYNKDASLRIRSQDAQIDGSEAGSKFSTNKLIYESKFLFKGLFDYDYNKC